MCIRDRKYEYNAFSLTFFAFQNLKKTYSNATEFAEYYVYINSIQVKVPLLQDNVDKLKASFELIKLCNYQQTSEEDTREEKVCY